MSSLIEEIEAIKANPDLTPEDKKKQIKRLRRKARRSGEAPSPKAEKKAAETEAQAVTLEELLVAVREYFTSNAQEVSPGTIGYAFSLVQAAQLGIKDPVVFANKFQKRWGYEPKTWFILASKADTMLLLGPTR